MALHQCQQQAEIMSFWFAVKANWKHTVETNGVEMCFRRETEQQKQTVMQQIVSVINPCF